MVLKILVGHFCRVPRRIWRTSFQSEEEESDSSDKGGADPDGTDEAPRNSPGTGTEAKPGMVVPEKSWKAFLLPRQTSVEV